MGNQIKNMRMYENYTGQFFMVKFGNGYPKTMHRSFIESWQYRVLERFVKSGRVFKAERREK